MRQYQPSFSAGEISESLHARSDLARYHVALALAKNWLVKKQGGISTREGLEFIYRMQNSERPWFLPFEFNTEQQYILVFSNEKLRIVRNGGMVLADNKTITAWSSGGGSTTFTSAAHGYSVGTEVFISGTGTDLDNRFLDIQFSATNTFTIDLPSSGWTGAGTVAEVFTLSMPYLEAQLEELGWTQSNDVMTLVHKSHDPANLSRADHNDWSIADIVFESQLTPPTDVNAVQVGANTTDAGALSTHKNNPRQYRYVVTTADDEGDESEPSEVAGTILLILSTVRYMDENMGVQLDWSPVSGASYYNVYKESAPSSGQFGFIGEADARPDTAIAITDITAADPAVVTTTSAHGLESGDSVWIQDISSADTEFTQLNDFFWRITKIDATNFSLNTIDATGASGAHSGSGEIRLRPGFTDYNLGPDLSQTPPIGNAPFTGADNYPRATTYHQQRLAFGGTINQPQTIFLTKTGDYNNMDYSRPRRADDSIEQGLVHSQVNEIRHLISMDDLVALTSGGIWVIKADENGVMTPENINPRRQGGRGASFMKPLIVGGTALFVEKAGRRIRDLRYTLDVDRYSSGDLSLYAEHLFENRVVVDWCYAEEPHSVVWVIFSDGKAAALTYVRDQEVWGWSQHETGGEFITCKSIRENDQDVVYFGIKRGTDYCIERMSPRNMETAIRDSFCVDSGLTFTGDSFALQRIDNGVTTLVTAPNHGLSNDDRVFIRDVVGLESLNDRRFRVANAATNTFELNDEEGRDIDSSTYGAYVSGGTVEACTLTISNLWHLEGQTVVAMADGNVVPERVVADGRITLESHSHKVHVGLPYICDLKTLPIDFKSGGQVAATKKAVAAVDMRTKNTRGLSVGGSTDKLYEAKERTPTIGYDNLPGRTGIQRFYTATTWSNDGQMYVRQAYPLPANVLSIIPELEA